MTKKEIEKAISEGIVGLQSDKEKRAYKFGFTDAAVEFFQPEIDELVEALNRLYTGIMNESISPTSMMLAVELIKKHEK